MKSTMSNGLRWHHWGKHHRTLHILCRHRYYQLLPYHLLFHNSSRGRHQHIRQPLYINLNQYQPIGLNLQILFSPLLASPIQSVQPDYGRTGLNLYLSMESYKFFSLTVRLNLTIENLSVFLTKTKF